MCVHVHPCARALGTVSSQDVQSQSLGRLRVARASYADQLLSDGRTADKCCPSTHHTAEAGGPSRARGHVRHPGQAVQCGLHCWASWPSRGQRCLLHAHASCVHQGVRTPASISQPRQLVQVKNGGGIPFGGLPVLSQSVMVKLWEKFLHVIASGPCIEFQRVKL